MTSSDRRTADARGAGMTFDPRYERILAELGMTPFYRESATNPMTGELDSRILGERPRMRWRVGQAEWDRLADGMRANGWPLPGPVQAQLGGFPIDADPELDPGAIVFEPY